MYRIHQQIHYITINWGYILGYSKRAFDLENQQGKDKLQLFRR